MPKKIIKKKISLKTKNLTKDKILLLKSHAKKHPHHYIAGVTFFIMLAISALVYPGFLVTKANTITFLQTNWGNPGDYESINNMFITGEGKLELASTGFTWSEDPVKLDDNLPSKSEISFPQIEPTSDGGFLVVWLGETTNTPVVGDYRFLYAQKVNPDGTVGNTGSWTDTPKIIAGEPAGGHPDPIEGSSYPGAPKLIKTMTQGGIDDYLVVWKKTNTQGGDIMAQRIKSDGTIGYQEIGDIWVDGGISIGKGDYQIPVSMGDGSVIVFWSDSTYNFKIGNLFAIKIENNGEKNPDWTSNINYNGAIGGVLVKEESETYNQYSFNAISSVIPDSSDIDGAIVTWVTGFSGGYKVYARKILSDNGDLDWPSDEILNDGTNNVAGDIYNYNYNTFIQIERINDEYLTAFRCPDPGEQICLQYFYENPPAGISQSVLQPVDSDQNNTVYPRMVPGNDGFFVGFYNYNNDTLIQKINLTDKSYAWGTQYIRVENFHMYNMSANNNGGVTLIGTGIGNSNILIKELNSSGQIIFEKDIDNFGLSDASRFDSFLSSSGEITFFWDGNYGLGTFQTEGSQITPSNSNGIRKQSGSLVSKIFNFGSKVDIGSFNWSANIPPITDTMPPIDEASITIETRSANSLPSSKSHLADATARDYCKPPTCGVEFPPSYINNQIIPETFNNDESWINDFGGNGDLSIPEWVALEWQDEQEIGKVVMHSISPFGDPTPPFPTEYKIQTSSNGIDWEDQIVVPGAIDEDSEAKSITHTFTPVFIKYLRIYMTNAEEQPGVGGARLLLLTEVETDTGSGGGWSCEFGVDCPSTIISHANANCSNILPYTCSGSYTPTSPNGKYFQYKLTFTRGSTPTLNSISVSGIPVISGGVPTPPTYTTLKDDEEKPGEISNQECNNYQIDTGYLKKLAIKIWGDENKWKDLVDDTYSKCPGKLKDPMTLDICKKEEVKEKVVIPPVKQPEPAGRFYTVQPRDYLLKIAEKLYGSKNQYYRLIILNQDKYPSLRTNPDYLKAGWNLLY